MDTRSLIVSVALATLGLGSVSAIAQPAPREGGPEARRPENRMPPGAGNLDRAIEQLDLTPEQRKQVEPILADMREKVRTALQETQQELGDVLTDEQRTQLREIMRDQRGGGQGPMAQGPNPVERLQSAAKALDLTNDQKAKLKEIFASYRTELETIRKNADNDRQAMQESRPLLQEMRSKVNAILTPEQTETLQKELGARERAAAPDRGAGKDRPDRPARGEDGAPRNKDAKDNR